MGPSTIKCGVLDGQSENHHYVRGHGRDPYAFHVSAFAVSAADIAEAAVGAAEAGAAIVHLHARNPADGRPDQTPEAFAPFLKEIKHRSNVVVNLTTGGSPYMKVEERILPAKLFKPEVASLNMGSMNFGLFPMLKRFKEFRYDWERPMLENSRDLVFRNSYKDIEYALRMLNETETRYEFECYDTSHLYNLRYFLDEKLVKPPLFVQTVFGILGGIGPHPEDVLHMKRTADRLFGSDYRWSVLGAGKAQMPDRLDGGRHGRQCTGRARGLTLDRGGKEGRLECAAGSPSAQDH
jgi:uncharacterized protein (DUF849 family)